MIYKCSSLFLVFWLIWVSKVVALPTPSTLQDDEFNIILFRRGIGTQFSDAFSASRAAQPARGADHLSRAKMLRYSTNFGTQAVAAGLAIKSVVNKVPGLSHMAAGGHALASVGRANGILPAKKVKV